MGTALDNVMAQAETAAANFVPVPLPTPANDVQTGALARPTIDDFIDGGGMDVDEFIQVKPDGFRVGKLMGGLLEELTVTLDLSEVTPIYSARFESGGATTFLRSYDGATTVEGLNFQREVARLTAINEKCSGVYKSAEIPMTLIDDLADPKAKSTLVIDAGTRIGLTPSVTGFKPFQSFLKKVRAADPSLLNGEVTVKLTHLKRVNSKNNEWGVIEFALVDAD